MRRTIIVEMEIPKDCNNCDFLRTCGFSLDNYCILSREELDEVCGRIDEGCPFLKETNSIVKIP